MSKRKDGKGALYQRGDGRWEAQFRLAGGSRKSVYGATRREALSKLRELRWTVSHGVPVSSRKLHLGGYLEYWLEMTKSRVRPSTFPELRAQCGPAQQPPRSCSARGARPSWDPGDISTPKGAGTVRLQRPPSAPHVEPRSHAGFPLGIDPAESRGAGVSAAAKAAPDDRVGAGRAAAAPERPPRR